MTTELSTKKLGGNIDSWCGKCKLVLAHTIEAMVGDKPARVHCNTCKSQHSYKPNAPGGTSRQSTAREPGKRRVGRYQSLLNAKNNTEPRIYSPKERYEQGNVLDHPTFGRGITTAVKDETKIEVLFESGSKTLVHGR
jgi:hypothetical protein